MTNLLGLFCLTMWNSTSLTSGVLIDCQFWGIKSELCDPDAGVSDSDLETASFEDG